MADNVEFTDYSDEQIAKIVKLSKAALNSAGKVVKEAMKTSLPRKTGVLVDKQIGYKTFIDDNNDFTCVVGYKKFKKKSGKTKAFWVNPYWIEFGTKPHVIKTKELSTYGFSSYKLGGYNGQYFGYKANHPGSKGRDYLRSAAYNNVSEIETQMGKKLAQLEKYMNAADIDEDEGKDDDMND